MHKIMHKKGDLGDFASNPTTGTYNRNRKLMLHWARTHEITKTE